MTATDPEITLVIGDTKHTAVQTAVLSDELTEIAFTDTFLSIDCIFLKDRKGVVVAAGDASCSPSNSATFMTIPSRTVGFGALYTKTAENFIESVAYLIVAHDSTLDCSSSILWNPFYNPITLTYGIV